MSNSIELLWTQVKDIGSFSLHSIYKPDVNFPSYLVSIWNSLFPEYLNFPALSLKLGSMGIDKDSLPSSHQWKPQTPRTLEEQEQGHWGKGTGGRRKLG